MAKAFYEPIKTPGKTGAKITIPSWVETAAAYKFERDDKGRLIYTPVVV